MGAQEVGRVVALWRYPVKSMAAERLEEIDVSWAGFAGDRRWAFVRTTIPRSGFPWMTIREKATMLHYRPRFVEPGRPDKSRTMVRTPAGEELDVVDPGLAASLGDGRAGDQAGPRGVRRDAAVADHDRRRSRTSASC